VHRLTEMARNAVEEFIRNGRTLSAPEDIQSEFNEKSGVFVCLKKQGNLRGCIGTFVPTTENVACETVNNAISAAVRDPRFSPVSAAELPELEYSVDVLSPPEKISGIDGLDPKKYGVILKSGHKRGLLLPDLEGVDTVEEQLRITRLKAGILPDEPVEIFRFTVSRYS